MISAGQVVLFKSLLLLVRAERLELPTFRFEVSMVGIVKITKDNNISII